MAWPDVPVDDEKGMIKNRLFCAYMLKGQMILYFRLQNASIPCTVP